jgi:hypothetical protein
MTDMRPVAFYWDSQEGVMTPMHRHRGIAEKQFQDGRAYILEVVEPRSDVSHRHYHASIRSAWLNLPSDLAEQFPSETHLRKWALCKAGFADERTIVCTSRQQAHQFAALCRTLDQYSVITVRDKVVRIFTAQSQSYHSMDRKRFQESKQKSLDIIAGLIGVDPATLAAQNPQHFNRPRGPEPPTDDAPMQGDVT